MSAEFQECLKKGRIKKFSRGRALVGKELGTAGQDLIDAKDSFKLKKYKWSTIQAYYSMFHSARALLYARDYREKSHYCLIVALRHLYVDKKLLPASIVESLNRAKTLRENARLLRSMVKRSSRIGIVFGAGVPVPDWKVDRDQAIVSLQGIDHGDNVPPWIADRIFERCIGIDSLNLEALLRC